jgi:ATP-binding cassette subfamily C protein CydCD
MAEMIGKSVLRSKDTTVLLCWPVVFGVLAAAATIAQALLLAEVIARVLVDEAEDPVGLWGPLAGLLAAVVAHSACVWLREVSALRGAAHAKQRVRERLLDHLLALGPAYVDGQRTGELVTTTVEGVERLQAYFARYLPQVVLGAVVPLLIAACVAWLDPLSGVVLLFTGPAVVVLMVLIGKRAEERTRLQWHSLSRMGAHFLDALRGLPTLKAFGRAEAERERVARISGEFGKSTLGVLRVAFVSGFALEFIATVSVALVAVLLAVRLLFADLPFAVALPVLLLAPEFYRPLRDLGASRHAGMEGKASAERIEEILALPVHNDRAGASGATPRGPVTVELVGVGFAYPGGKRPALSGADLVLPAGTRTALVGASGAGKSTLVDLLLRFAEPLDGRILANGIPLADLAPEDWRENVALAPQRPILFHGSVLENLRMARPGATQGEVEEAAGLAGADGFVRRLPMGYETQIGERGVRLSEGEVRRLGIARAFLKDAPLIVMDEPASDLDPESERLLEAALEGLGRDRTVLLVAHRLGAARSADRIAVLEEGSLAEIGTHEELLGGDGAYARLAGAAAGSLGGKGGGPTRRVGGSRAGGSPEGVEGRDAATAAGDGVRDDGDAEGGAEGGGRRGRTLGRLLRFMRPQRGKAALAALLGTWTAAANVGLLAASAYLVSASALKPPLSTLIPAAVLVQVLGSSRGVSRYYERLVSHEVTFGLLTNLRAWLYGRLVPLSPARLVRRRGGDLLSRMVDDVEELQDFYLRAISPLVTATLVAALVAVTLYHFAPLPAMSTLLFMALAGLGAPVLVGAVERGLGKRQVELRAALGAGLAEWLGGMRDLLAFGRAEDGRREISELGGRLGREQGKAAFATGMREGLHALFAGLAMWTALVVAVGLADVGRIASVYVALLPITALAGFEAVRPLGEALQSLGRTLAAGERVFGVADSEPAVADPVGPLAAPAGRALEFDRVTFRYGEAEAPALEDVSFALAAGKKVAVVGPSGAGKSTLVNLLLRFWDPTLGEVRLDGRDLRSYEQEAARAVISVAAQDAHVFDATLRENLLLARPGATEQELWAALQTARLGGVVEGLPCGLDAPLGELGTRLSGGERRRFTAARAYLKDAPFLVMDEPTADLDAETERLFLDALHERADGRGLILITHRLLRMERMDEILVLDEGRIAERGTHRELMDTNGLYARMVGVQEQMLAGR